MDAYNPKSICFGSSVSCVSAQFLLTAAYRLQTFNTYIAARPDCVSDGLEKEVHKTLRISSVPHDLWRGVSRHDPGHMMLVVDVVSVVDVVGG